MDSLPRSGRSRSTRAGVVLTSLLLLAWLTFVGGPGCAGRSAKPKLGGYPPATPESLEALRDIDLRLSKAVIAGNEVVFPPTAIPTIRFRQPGQIAGRAPINRYFGAYELGSGGALQWSGPGVGASRMAGPPALMQLESQFTSALLSTTQLGASANGVRFRSGDGSTVLEFVK